jgi:hypothetical protein
MSVGAGRHRRFSSYPSCVDVSRDSVGAGAGTPLSYASITNAFIAAHAAQKGRAFHGVPRERGFQKTSQNLQSGAGSANILAACQGRWKTTFTQSSFLSRNVLYSSGPSSSVALRCVMRKVGSIVPS